MPIRRWIPFVLLSILLFIVYSNSLSADWQMDDRPNIIDNPGLRIDNLMPESLWGTFFANQGKSPKLFRPLPCLSFALNWYAGQNDPFGYHLVNLTLHCMVACTLYLLIVNLLVLLVISKKFESHDRKWVQGVALLATVLWATNPIQTQAVTYIVQRMAIMATLFYVLGMLYYLKARTASKARYRWSYGTASFLFFICGIASKENAIMMPLAIGLIELLFFKQGCFKFVLRPKSLVAATAIFFSCLLVIHFTIGLPFNYVLDGYHERPFTMMERILTQPRIVLGYLTQIFFPAPDRLSIAHDVTLSTSLFQPWTTLPAIGLVAAFVSGAILVADRYPVLSFSILFYFLNHVVESSILPLELVFEHRNYLPSLFLFLPVATMLCRMTMRVTPRTSFFQVMAAGIATVVLVGVFGLGTYYRNKAWATSETLWRDAAVKAPGTIRPMVNLAIQLAWRKNPTPSNYRHALVLFQHSLNLTPNRSKEQAEILGNMASIYFHQGNNAKAIDTYLQAIDINPVFLKNRSDLIKPLVMEGKFKEAEHHARQLLIERPDNPDYHLMMGFILLWEDKPQESLTYFRAAMKRGLRSPALIFNTGVALTRLNNFQNGQWFLKMAANQIPDDPNPLFSLIENRILAGDLKNVEFYALKLISAFPIKSIAARFQNLHQNFSVAPINGELIMPVIQKAVQSFDGENLIKN